MFKIVIASGDGATDAKRGGDTDRGIRSRQNFFAVKTLADAFGDSRRLWQQRIRQHHTKLLAPDAPGDIVAAQRLT